MHSIIHPESLQIARDFANKPSDPPPSRPGSEIIARARRARNRGKFNRLWSGDISGYPSPREAMLALCNLLAFHAGPARTHAQIEHLANQSALSKLDEEWSLNSYYSHFTVDRAIRGVLNRTKRNSEDKRSFTPQTDNPRTEQLSSDETAESVRLAQALAASDGDRPPHEVMFILARRLFRLAGKGGGELFSKAVVAFCEKLTKPVDDYMFTFLDCCDKVILAEGDDPFDWAVNMAKKKPYTWLPQQACTLPFSCLSDLRTVASIAYYLQMLPKPQMDIVLPVGRVAAALNANDMRASRIIKRLQTYGLLVCTKTTWSIAKHQAKRYCFIGPQPGADECPA